MIFWKKDKPKNDDTNPTAFKNWKEIIDDDLR